MILSELNPRTNQFSVVFQKIWPSAGYSTVCKIAQWVLHIFFSQTVVQKIDFFLHSIFLSFMLSFNFSNRTSSSFCLCVFPYYKQEDHVIIEKCKIFHRLLSFSYIYILYAFVTVTYSPLILKTFKSTILSVQIQLNSFMLN